MAANPAAWVDEVSRDEALANTAEIARWVRLSGSDDERKAFDFIAEKLQGYGLKTWFHNPTCLVSLPISGALLLDDAEPFAAITHAFSRDTGPAGVAGELVYAHGGSAAELLAAGAIGKIALTDGLATPQKAKAGTDIGALAVVCISGDPVHEMIVSGVWGSPTPRTLDQLPDVPIISIDTAAGQQLRARLEKGRVRARVQTEVDTSWRPIPVLVADLDTDGRDYVMFSGHVDSWHYGAMDNGSANATMMETARVLARHRGELRRGLRFAFWSGHSHARYASSTWFADAYWFDLRERCVAHINVDSTGAIGATVLSDANTMAETHDIAAEVIQRQTGQKLVYNRFGRAGDQSFWGVGLSSVFMSLSQQGPTNEPSAADLAGLLGSGSSGTIARSGGLGWWWHTTEDTLDKIDPDNLERDIKVYVEVVGRFACDPVVPLNLTRVVDELSEALKEIEPLWAGLPAGGDDDTASFAALRADLAACRAAAERVRAGSGDDAARSRAIVAAGKALVPVNYTVSGEFEHDPALGATTLPALRPHKPVIAMSDDERWGATHQLRRALNRVRAGVRDATRILEAAG
jgi:hypothetical protein